MLKREQWSGTMRPRTLLQDDDVMLTNTESMPDVSSQEAPAAAVDTQAGMRVRHNQCLKASEPPFSHGHPNNHIIRSANLKACNYRPYAPDSPTHLLPAGCARSLHGLLKGVQYFWARQKAIASMLCTRNLTQNASHSLKSTIFWGLGKLWA